MDFHKTLILLLFGLSFNFCARFPLRKYYYISTKLAWKDAQRYCREKHTDLATFDSMEEVNQLSRPADVSSGSWVWIGLHDDPASWKGTLGNDSNSWKWSTTGQPITSEYHNWVVNEPNNWNSIEAHAAIMDTGEWGDFPAGYLRPFVCYTDNGPNQKTYEYISTVKTWSDAQSYCRQHYTDLAVITSSEENSRVQSIVPATTEPWIGLYRQPWIWSDNNPITFTNWESGQPNNLDLAESCGYELNNHVWGDSRCGIQDPFICHEVRKAKNTMKLKMKTTADLTDPAVNEQILQKINAALKSQGYTDVKLEWTTPPDKA